MSGLEIYNAVDRLAMTQDQYIKHSFSWQLLEMTDAEWHFQLTFNEPDIISMEIPADYVEIKFWNQELFQSKRGGFV